MGDDWAGRFNDVSPNVQVVYLPRTPDISSTSVIERIRGIETGAFVTKKGYPDLPWKTYQLVACFQEVMDHFKIPFFFSSGTLLGAVRHGGMMPHDDDVDCCLQEEYLEQFVGSVLPVLNKFEYRATPTNKGWRGMQIKRGGDAFVETAQLDVFIMKRDKKGVYVYPTGWPWMKLTESKIFPLRKIQFGPVLINAPNDIKDFLNQNFGENWGTHRKIYSHTNGGVVGQLEPLCNAEDFLPAGPFSSHSDSMEIKDFSQSSLLGLEPLEEIIAHVRTIPEALPSEVSYDNGFTMTYGYSWGEKAGARFLHDTVEFLFVPPASWESNRFKVNLIGYKIYNNTLENQLSLLDNGNNIDVKDDEGQGFSFLVDGKQEHNLILTMNWGGRACDNLEARSSDARWLTFLLQDVKIEPISLN